MVAIPTPKKDVIPYHLLSQYSGFNHNSDLIPGIYLSIELPFNMGQILAIIVIPPAPRYCPIATSCKKIGTPQNNMQMK